MHGPLARTEIGQHKVQGVDYAYTLHGLLKNVNSGTLNETREMGLNKFVHFLIGSPHLPYSVMYGILIIFV
jgi:hypothetical protein